MYADRSTTVGGSQTAGSAQDSPFGQVGVAARRIHHHGEATSQAQDCEEANKALQTTPV